ncbi:MAG TPA: hypothetical protein VD704_04495 [Gaiellaceae bacterium]|nr:hypothetical protein [Gaiellaceae bacterium]
MATNTISRTMHDVGLALWTGGSTMGAVGVNGAATAAEPRERLRVAGEGWNRWMPVHMGAVAAYGLGSLGLTLGNRGRLRHQDGVARLAVTKTVLTAAALAADAYAGVLGRRAERAGEIPVEGATDPAPETPADVASTLRRLKVVQWAVPALTGALVVLSARMGEQQRPEAVARGMRKRFLGR